MMGIERRPKRKAKKCARPGCNNKPALGRKMCQPHIDVLVWRSAVGRMKPGSIHQEEALTWLRALEADIKAHSTR